MQAFPYTKQYNDMISTIKKVCEYDLYLYLKVTDTCFFYRIVWLKPKQSLTSILGTQIFK